MYKDLSYGQKELSRAMRDCYDELIDFISTDHFKLLMDELGELDSRDRPNFVQSIILKREELQKRNIIVPSGILIQRSAFGDRRPTLFCVKKYLPTKYSDVWQNVNITFDNEFVDQTVSRSPEISWRNPLPVEVQSVCMAEGRNLEDVQSPLN